MYRRKDTGEVRGREDWALTVNRDGSRTLRSLALTDDSAFVRDVTFTIDQANRPQDVFVRLQVGPQFIGAGYFHTDGNTLRLVADTAERGHTDTCVGVPSRFHIMTHAVMHDGWTFWACDQTGPADQSITCYNTSTQWNGTDGPVGRVEEVQITFVGTERVLVPAGNFEARHYTVGSNVLKVPLSDLWVAGDHNVLVRYDWPKFGLEYVLESWHEEQAG